MRRFSVYLGSAAYALLIFAGASLWGFVVAPILGTASGLFSIDVESRSFFSMLTLKGIPTLAALSALSAALYPAFSTRRFRILGVVAMANVLVAWSVAAAIALFTLG